jgi:hypothetical protein
MTSRRKGRELTLEEAREIAARWERLQEVRDRGADRAVVRTVRLLTTERLRRTERTYHPTVGGRAAT